MADVDMYDYILTVPQPALIVQAPKPGPPPPQPKMSDREKEKKEEIEVRIWYAGLSREKQKEIRKRQFTYPPKCYCAKTVVVKCTCHEPKKEPAPKPEPPKLEKPQKTSYLTAQLWAGEKSQTAPLRYA